jgi:uncharacterized protein YbcI
LENTTDTGREISRGMVALLKRYLGRGPTHARAHIDENLVVVLFRDTMIQAERTLMEEGRKDKVRNLRKIFQGAFRDDAIELVQEVTGREVAAFLSDHAVDPDYAVEVFVLADRAAPRRAGPEARG